jgi:hypothetical protein
MAVKRARTAVAMNVIPATPMLASRRIRSPPKEIVLYRLYRVLATVSNFPGVDTFRVVSVRKNGYSPAAKPDGDVFHVGQSRGKDQG